MPPIVSAVNVPTLVRLDPVTPLANEAPVNVPAAAVTVMFAVPSKLVPLMARAVCNAVAVAALPVVLPLEPVTLPTIAAVTVSVANVPTLVRLDAVTPLASVAPVNVPAAAVTVTLAVPSKLVPLIVRAVANAVAVLALPVSAAVTVPALKLPDASRATTLLAVLASVASTANVMAALPLNGLPVR